MRLFLGLAALLFVGCEVTESQVRTEPVEARLPVTDFVTVPRLARNLSLDYVTDHGGLIELSAPPDHVMLVEESTQALVNGEKVDMGHPCIRRGEEFVLRAEDAERLTSLLAQLRDRRKKDEAKTEIEPQEAATPKPRRLPLPPEWEPEAGLERPWRYIVIHHQAAPKGNASLIHRVHLSRGMDGLGYHFVVGNGSLSPDGQVEVGFRWRKQIHGAHTRVRRGDDNRWNMFGIGVCLVGDFRATAPSEAQLMALVRLVRRLRFAYKIPADRVVPHDFVKPTICPGPKFPWAEFHARIR